MRKRAEPSGFHDASFVRPHHCLNTHNNTRPLNSSFTATPVVPPTAIRPVSALRPSSQAVTMRIYLPPHIRDPLYSSIARLEINFDPRVGLKRLKRKQWTWRKDGQYAPLVIVSRVSGVWRSSRWAVGTVLRVGLLDDGLGDGFGERTLREPPRHRGARTRPAIWIADRVYYHVLRAAADASVVHTQHGGPRLTIPARRAAAARWTHST